VNSDDNCEHSAQVVVPYKQEVVGSIPAAPTDEHAGREGHAVFREHTGPDRDWSSSCAAITN